MLGYDLHRQVPQVRTDNRISRCPSDACYAPSGESAFDFSAGTSLAVQNAPLVSCSARCAGIRFLAPRALLAVTSAAAAAHFRGVPRHQAPPAFKCAAAIRRGLITAVLDASCGIRSVVAVRGTGCVPSVTGRQIIMDSLTGRQENPQGPRRSASRAALRTRFSNSSVRAVALAFTCCVRGVVGASSALSA